MSPRDRWRVCALRCISLGMSTVTEVSTSFALATCFAPIAKFILVHFNIQVCYPGLQSLLHVGHRLVVNAGAEFFQEE